MPMMLPMMMMVAHCEQGAARRRPTMCSSASSTIECESAACTSSSASPSSRRWPSCTRRCERCTSRASAIRLSLSLSLSRLGIDLAIVQHHRQQVRQADHRLARCTSSSRADDHAAVALLLDPHGDAAQSFVSDGILLINTNTITNMSWSKLDIMHQGIGSLDLSHTRSTRFVTDQPARELHPLVARAA